MGFWRRRRCGGRFAAVEGIADGVDGFAAVGAGGEGAGVGERAKSAGEIGLAEDVAGLRDAPVGQEGALGIRPGLEVLHAVGDRHHAEFIDGEAVGKFNSGLEDFGGGLGAVLAEGYHGAFDDAGDERGEDAGDGDPVFESAGFGRGDDFVFGELVIAKELSGGELGHGADACDSVDLAVLCTDEDGGFTAESEVGRTRDGGGEHGGAPRRRHFAVEAMRMPASVAYSSPGDGLRARKRSVRAAALLPQGDRGGESNGNHQSEFHMVSIGIGIIHG